MAARVERMAITSNNSMRVIPETLCSERFVVGGGDNFETVPFRVAKVCINESSRYHTGNKCII